MGREADEALVVAALHAGAGDYLTWSRLGRLEVGGRPRAARGAGAQAARGRGAVAARGGGALPRAHRGDPRADVHLVGGPVRQPRLREPADQGHDRLHARGVAGGSRELVAQHPPRRPRARAGGARREARLRRGVLVRVPHAHARGARHLVARRRALPERRRRAAAVPARAHRRRDRAQAGGRDDQAPHVLRRADRPAQPRAAAGAPAAGAAQAGTRRAGRWRCCCSTSTTSARSTTRSAATTATSVIQEVARRLVGRDGRVAAGGAPARRRVRAAAAGRRPAAREADGVAPAQGARAAGDGAPPPGRGRRPASASPSRPSTARRARRCSGGPTSPCRRRSARGRARSPTRPTAIPTTRTAWSCWASCAARSRASSWCCTTSRRWTCATAAVLGVEALVRWRHPQARACWPPIASSASPSRAGSSSR